MCQLYLYANDTNGILDKIQKVQNKVVRAVFGKRDYRAEFLTVLYKRLKWLKIKETRKCHDIISLEAMLKFSTPLSIYTKFNITHTHRHNTRYTRNRFRLTNETTSFNTVRSSSFVCR